MKLPFFQSPKHSKTFARMIVCAAVMTMTSGLSAQDSVVEALYGVETNSIMGTSASSTGFFVQTDFMGDGGAGSETSDLDVFGSEVSAMLFGNAGSPATPLLKSKSTPIGVDDAARGYAGAMATYQYNGAEAATISFNWSLTGFLTEPADTFASLSATAGLVTNANVFATFLDDLEESGANIEADLFRNINTPGGINDMGTISFEATPGQQFALAMTLLTLGSRDGAIADGSSTFTGTLSSSSGSISVVPEPASMGVGVVIGLAVLLRRRRRRPKH